MNVGCKWICGWLAETWHFTFIAYRGEKSILKDEIRNQEILLLNQNKGNFLNVLSFNKYEKISYY